MSNLRLDLLTDEELIEYQALLTQVEVDNRWKSLRDLNEDTPKNYRFLYESYYSQKYEGEKLVAGKKGVVLEGSARSAKTFSALKFICKVCTDSKESLVVNIIKETYNEFKTTLYKDFRVILTELGMDNPFERLKEVDSFKINNSYVNFIGADNANKIHGNTSDIIYFNEVIPIDEGVFRQSIMRCSKFWIIDYNPSVTEHWVYSKVIPRPDVGYLRTTFRDNPLIPLQQKLEILAYEPYATDSYEIVADKEIYYNGAVVSETNQPPPHEENIANGTADLFMWTVYGLGLRGAMQGVIFRNIKYIEKEDVPQIAYIYGMDFGFTSDPTSFHRYWQQGNKIYSELLCYRPIDNPKDIIDMMEQLDIEMSVPIICDSSDRYTSGNNGTVEMVLSLQEAGYEAMKISKTKGIMYWLNTLRQCEINVVVNELTPHVRKEIENYKFKEIQGILINQPVDRWNHWADTLRYTYMAYNDNLEIETEWN